jgi:hypothetical protein
MDISIMAMGLAGGGSRHSVEDAPGDRRSFAWQGQACPRIGPSPAPASRSLGRSFEEDHLAGCQLKLPTGSGRRERGLNPPDVAALINAGWLLILEVLVAAAGALANALSNNAHSVTRIRHRP